MTVERRSERHGRVIPDLVEVRLSARGAPKCAEATECILPDRRLRASIPESVVAATTVPRARSFKQFAPLIDMLLALTHMANVVYRVGS